MTSYRSRYAVIRSNLLNINPARLAAELGVDEAALRAALLDGGVVPTAIAEAVAKAASTTVEELFDLDEQREATLQRAPVRAFQGPSVRVRW
jgi:hypothetical protein